MQNDQSVQTAQNFCSVECVQIFNLLAFGAPYEYTKLVMSRELLTNLNIISVTAHSLCYKHTAAETFRSTHTKNCDCLHSVNAFCRITLQQTVPTLAVNKTLTHLHICATKATNSQLTQHPFLHNHQLYIQKASTILHFLPGIKKKKLSEHCNIMCDRQTDRDRATQTDRQRQVNL